MAAVDPRRHHPLPEERQTKTVNAFVSVKGAQFNFQTELELRKGSVYGVGRVIDVKDADGREKQISSDPQSVSIP